MNSDTLWKRGTGAQNQAPSPNLQNQEKAAGIISKEAMIGGTTIKHTTSPRFRDGIT
jgi:hypothetical protein